MSNCNAASTPIVEGLCLVPAPDNFIPNPKDALAYKQFTGNAQWLACQTRPNILQTVSKLSHHNMKPTDQMLERGISPLTLPERNTDLRNLLRKQRLHLFWLLRQLLGR